MLQAYTSCIKNFTRRRRTCSSRSRSWLGPGTRLYSQRDLSRSKSRALRKNSSLLRRSILTRSGSSKTKSTNLSLSWSPSQKLFTTSGLRWKKFKLSKSKLWKVSTTRAFRESNPNWWSLTKRKAISMSRELSTAWSSRNFSLSTRSSRDRSPTTSCRFRAFTSRKRSSSTGTRQGLRPSQCIALPKKRCIWRRYKKYRHLTKNLLSSKNHTLVRWKIFSQKLLIKNTSINKNLKNCLTLNSKILTSSYNNLNSRRAFMRNRGTMTQSIW